MGIAANGHSPDWASLDAVVADTIAARRLLAEAQVREVRQLAAAVDIVVARAQQLRDRDTGRRSDADLPLREVCAELAAAMRLSDRSVQRRMGDAARLVADYPATLTAWEAGEIDAGHAAAILDAGLGVSDDHRARYEILALDAARRETAGRLQSIARVIAARIDPDGAAERLSARRADRGIRIVDLDDGMARLLVDLPATLAHAILDRLTRMAHTVRNGTRDGTPADSADDATVAEDCVDDHQAGASTVVTGPGRRRAAAAEPDEDPRTLDQLRADILSDLLLAAAPIAHGSGLDAITGHVQVTVPVLTLAGVSREPAVLAGHGPVDAVTARCLAGRAPGWDRVLTHPFSGAVLAVDRYRATSQLTRYLRARDERCRFPGCRRVARGCDLDHTLDAALGGPTCATNLSHLCRRHHTLKHETAWQVRQLPGGVLQWTSPVGRLYLDHPPAIVTFVPEPDDDAPPF